MATTNSDDEKGNAREKRAQWEAFSFNVAQVAEGHRAGKVNVANNSYDDPVDHTYTVTVAPDSRAVECTCPDHEYRGKKCKHMLAVEETEPVVKAASGQVRTDGGTDDSCEYGWCDGPDGDDLPCFPCWMEAVGLGLD